MMIGYAHFPANGTLDPFASTSDLARNRMDEMRFDKSRRYINLAQSDLSMPVENANMRLLMMDLQESDGSERPALFG